MGDRDDTQRRSASVGNLVFMRLEAEAWTHGPAQSLAVKGLETVELKMARRSQDPGGEGVI